MSLQRSGTRKEGSLRRTGTRKAPEAPDKRGKGYDIVQQGIKQLYPLEDNAKVKSDIEWVPGLHHCIKSCLLVLTTS